MLILDYDGAESGIQQNNEFSVNAYGIKIVNKILYKDTDDFKQRSVLLLQRKMMIHLLYRLKQSIRFYGNSFRSNTTLHYFVSKSISMVFSLKYN